MPPSGARRAKRRIALVLAAATALQAAPAAAQRAVVKQRPLPRQILVVTANLQEAWDARDNESATDLAAFVKRLVDVTPHAPDVLLLQEVTRAATTKLARLLRQQTSRRYRIAASAGASPVEVRLGRALTRETAILINNQTMTKVGRPRYINTTYARRDGAKGELREIKRNAAALVRERASGKAFPVASVHFHTRTQLRSDRVSRRYREVWARRVTTVVGNTWPRHRDDAVIGGDFNEGWSRWKDRRRSPQRWWSLMRRRGYRDSAHAVGARGGVDYVFTRTGIAAAGVDSSYDPRSAAGTPAYYSDHKLRWALLGPWRPDARGEAVSSTVAAVSWKPLPGTEKVFLERRDREGSWQVVRTVPGTRTEVRDFRLEPVTRYRYRVVAWNGAERSTPSRVLRVRTLPDRQAPHRPDAPHLKVNTKKIALKLRWRRTADRGGSGGVRYEVWRTELGGDARRIKITDKLWYTDRGFSRQNTTGYFVVAFDRVGNRSRRSEAATLLPRLRGGPALGG